MVYIYAYLNKIKYKILENLQNKKYLLISIFKF